MHEELAAKAEQTARDHTRQAMAAAEGRKRDRAKAAKFRKREAREREFELPVAEPVRPIDRERLKGEEES
jgi:hypothetical protein